MHADKQFEWMVNRTCYQEHNVLQNTISHADMHGVGPIMIINELNGFLTKKKNEQFLVVKVIKYISIKSFDYDIMN